MAFKTIRRTRPATIKGLEAIACIETYLEILPIKKEIQETIESIMTSSMVVDEKIEIILFNRSGFPFSALVRPNAVDFSLWFPNRGPSSVNWSMKDILRKEKELPILLTLRPLETLDDEDYITWLSRDEEFKKQWKTYLSLNRDFILEKLHTKLDSFQDFGTSDEDYMVKIKSVKKRIEAISTVC